ncbi:MAG: hypothetical protein PHI84_17035 [Kiritimatiellae bacterium]|nr:hypothetical protein [Kiritimatiellia bacterium]
MPVKKPDPFSGFLFMAGGKMLGHHPVTLTPENMDRKIRKSEGHNQVLTNCPMEPLRLSIITAKHWICIGRLRYVKC